VSKQTWVCRYSSHTTRGTYSYYFCPDLAVSKSTSPPKTVGGKRKKKGLCKRFWNHVLETSKWPSLLFLFLFLYRIYCSCCITRVVMTCCFFYFCCGWCDITNICDTESSVNFSICLSLSLSLWSLPVSGFVLWGFFLLLNVCLHWNKSPTISVWQSVDAGAWNWASSSSCLFDGSLVVFDGLFHKFFFSVALIIILRISGNSASDCMISQVWEKLRIDLVMIHKNPAKKRKNSRRFSMHGFGASTVMDQYYCGG